MKGKEICGHLDRLASAGASLDVLLLAAVERIHDSSPSFHWTGIYELGADNALRLGPFRGAATEHVFITAGHGVCGSAVAECRNKNIPDVSMEPNYLACSTSTRSELVVLIRDQDRIYAQIDIDSNDLNAFDRKAERQVQKAADWLARAYADSLGERSE